MKAVLPPELSTACFRRDGYRCRHCGDSNSLTPHHVIYRSHGGTDNLYNLLTLCLQCHTATHSGKLRIEVRSLLANNLDVKFTRTGKWKPQ